MLEIFQIIMCNVNQKIHNEKPAQNHLTLDFISS